MSGLCHLWVRLVRAVRRRCAIYSLHILPHVADVDWGSSSPMSTMEDGRLRLAGLNQGGLANVGAEVVPLIFATRPGVSPASSTSLSASLGSLGGSFLEGRGRDGSERYREMSV